MSDDHSTSPAAGSTTTNIFPENVTLRIVILAHGNRREDDLYLVLSLDATLEELRARIQDSLPQRPSPNQQRIIYQGRGLEDGSETLRTILRQDPRAGNSSYVLHLVIRQVSPGSQPPPPAAPAIPNQPPTNPSMQAGQPQQPGVQLPQISPHDAHMRIHNQIHQLQHTLQHQQALHRAQFPQGLPFLPMAQQMRPDQTRVMQPGNPINLAAGQLPPMGQNNAVPGIGSPQITVSGRLSAPGQPNQPANATSATLPAHTELQVPHVHAAQPTAGHVPSPLMNTTQIRTTVNSDGQQTRTVINGGPNGTTAMTFRITGLNPPNPMDRPSSAPGASPSADANSDNRTVNPVPGNIQIQAQPPPMPMAFPFPSGLQLPFPVPNVAPLLHNPLQQFAAPNPTAQPMAWLLSSPSGPQGIVFAPGHGFFNTAPVTSTASTQPQSTPTQPQTASSSAVASLQQTQLAVRPQTPAAAPHAPQPGARPHAADLPVAAQPRARRVQARPNIDQNEILQFILNRGWLFLRLYMFVFVFSESGTWRRILMIGAIIIYCALPQQNRLTNALQVVRQHFDNLIGPPNIAQRPAQQAQQNGQNPDQANAARGNETRAQPSTSSGRRTAPTPTPEETARRLLEQQNRRNPNPVIDTLYRIEQGVVLFLASLVPGVGERHVRAREEARRILQEEEQRRTAETQQQSQPAIESGSSRSPGQSEAHGEAQRPEGEGGPLPDGWKTTTQSHDGTNTPQATSSGVDRSGRTENEGVRSRTTNPGQ